MLRRDYILKLIQDLFVAISNLLERDGDEAVRQKEIEALYATFGGDKDFFRKAEEDEMISTVAKVAASAQGVAPDQLSADEMLQRIELLAALMYADFKVSNISDNLRRDVATRALSLYNRVIDSSDTYSQERFDRVDELERFLSMGK